MDQPAAIPIELLELQIENDHTSSINAPINVIPSGTQWVITFSTKFMLIHEFGSNSLIHNAAKDHFDRLNVLAYPQRSYLWTIVATVHCDQLNVLVYPQRGFLRNTAATVHFDQQNVLVFLQRGYLWTTAATVHCD